MKFPYLTFKIDGAEDIDAPIDTDIVTLGRADDNTIVIPNTWISSHHARFVRNPDGSIQIIDLGSHNGIVVNGKPEKKRTLSHGDNLKFGLLEAVFFNGQTNPPPAATATKTPAPRARKSVERSKAKSEIDSLKATASSLIAEIASLEIQTTELRAAEQKFSDLTKTLDALALRKSRTEATIGETSSELQNLRDQLVQLATEEKKAAAAADSKKVEISDLSSNRDALKKEADTLEQRVRTLKETNLALERQAEAAERSKLDREELESGNEAAAKSARALAQEIASLTADRDMLKRQTAEMTSSTSALKSKSESLAKQQQEASKSRAELEQLSVEKQDAIKSAEILGREIGELTANRDALERESKKLAAEIKVQKKAQRATAESKLDLDHLNSEKKRSQQSTKALQREIDSLASNRETLASDVKRLEQKLEELRASQATFSQEHQGALDLAKNELAKLEADKDEAAQTTRALKTEIDGLTSTRDLLRRETDALALKLESLQDSAKLADQQRQQIEETKVELTRLIERRIDTEEKVVEVDKRRKNLESELGKLKAEIEKNKSLAAETATPPSNGENESLPELAPLTAHRDALAAEIASHTEKLADAKLKLSETWDQFTALSAERDAMKSKHDQSTSELQELQAQAEQLRGLIAGEDDSQASSKKNSQNGSPSKKTSRTNGRRKPHNSGDSPEIARISSNILGAKNS